MTENNTTNHEMKTKMNTKNNQPAVLICPTNLQRWESSIDVALDQAGFNIAIPSESLSDATGVGLVVVIGGLTDPEVADLNHVCGRSATPLLIITPQKDKVRIGPLVLIRQTACVECYQEMAKYFPYNGYHTAAENAFSNQDIARVIPHIEQAVHAILFEQQHTLYQGFSLEYNILGHEVGRVRACRAGACATCSTWIYYPTESHLSTYREDA